MVGIMVAASAVSDHTATGSFHQIDPAIGWEAAIEQWSARRTRLTMPCPSQRPEARQRNSAICSISTDLLTFLR